MVPRTMLFVAVATCVAFVVATDCDGKDGACQVGASQLLQMHQTDLVSENQTENRGQAQKKDVADTRIQDNDAATTDATAGNNLVLNPTPQAKYQITHEDKWFNNPWTERKALSDTTSMQECAVAVDADSECSSTFYHCGSSHCRCVLNDHAPDLAESSDCNVGKIQAWGLLKSGMKCFTGGCSDNANCNALGANKNSRSDCETVAQQNTHDYFSYRNTSADGVECYTATSCMPAYDWEDNDGNWDSYVHFSVTAPAYTKACENIPNLFNNSGVETKDNAYAVSDKYWPDVGCDDDYSGYDTWPNACGDYDDGDFQANTMCCSCGGGDIEGNTPYYVDVTYQA